MIDMGDAIALLGTGSYELRRRAAPTTYVNGRRVDPAMVSSTITGAVQPASGSDVQRLPEGVSSDETLVIFTTTSLYGALTGEPDRVVVGGVEYQVAKVEPWEANGNYCRALLTRVVQ